MIAKPDAAGYETLGPLALINLPPLPFLIDGVIPLHGLVVLVGPSGSFKSFYALHIAADVASRDDDPRNVLYVAAEGFYGLGQRLAAWQRQYRTIPEERLQLVSVAPKLLMQDDVDKVIATAQREKSAVIIVDTLARTFGGNENSTEDMTAYTDACGRISAETGALVIVVHHFGWNGERQRGSSALFAAADAELTVNRIGNDLTVKVTKGKDFQDGGSHHFTSKSVPTQAQGGTSLVLVRSDGVDAMMRAFSRDQKYLDALEAFGEKGANATEWWKKMDVPRRTFFDVRTRLIRTNKVVQDGKRYKVNRGIGAAGAE